jgi:hypothetical protein
MKRRIAEMPQRPAPRACPAGAEVGRPRWRLARTLAIALAAAVVIGVSCQPSEDPVTKERERTLDADERYLVEYYQKILDVAEKHHDNQAVMEEKKRELAAEIDSVRIRRVISRLEKNPEHWLAIYARLNEIASREASGDSTGRY